MTVGAVAERRDDLRGPAGDDRAHGLLRLLLRRPCGLRSGLGARNGQALQRRALFGQVDQAPVAEVPDNQLGDPLDRRLVIGRSGDVGDLPEQVEAALFLGCLGNRGTLGRDQAIAFALGALSLADVDEEARPE